MSLDSHMSWRVNTTPPTVVAVKADQRERLGQLLEEMDAEAGPVPAEVLDEARSDLGAASW